VSCPQCQAENEPGDRFCGACAAPLTAQTNAALPIVEASAETVTQPKSQRQESTSFSNDRYTLIGFLGEGKSKRVYHVHDVILDREVALALLKTEGIDELDRERIVREGQVMARLGEHPNVMPIYDLGYDNDTPYIVMPLMSGGSIESLRLSSDNRTLSIEQTLRIAKGVCSGLVFAHARGIVHRDLKPGNIWLNDGETPRIGDFGLAISMSLNRLTSPDVVIGTPTYMSPEQITGGDLDARSDLYAFGIMLYEMVTGAPPFSGDNPLAIIGQHMNTAPMTPTLHTKSCPKLLENLILKLLEKQPDQRPQTAQEVLDSLSALQSATANFTRTSITAIEPDDTPIPEDRFFVGRDRDVERLRVALENTIAGRGSVAMLSGEPGVGKSRLAQEIGRRSEYRGADVAWGRCYNETGLPPYWPWVQIVRSILRSGDPDDIARALGPGAPEIGEIVAEVSEILPGLRQPAKVENPRYARFRLFESLAAFFKNIAKETPTVILLDDLQWADEPSLLFLEFLARETRDQSILILGMYQDIGLSRQHPLTEVLSGLATEPHFQRISLGNLDEEAVGKIIEITSRVPPSPGVIHLVYSQTEGNPLFVTEVVRLLNEEGALEADVAAGSITQALRVPVGVREAIGGRLNHLPQNVNDSLTFAAVIGHEFGIRELQVVIEQDDPATLLDDMDQAVLSGMIEEVEGSPGRYRFVHLLTQQVLADQLSQTRRTILHSEIGAALEELYGINVVPHAAELARHFAEAAPIIGPEKQIHYSVLAGEHALSTYAYEEALQHYQTAFDIKSAQTSLSNATRIDDTMQIDQQTADILFGLGRSQRATATYQMHEAWLSLSKAFDYNVEAGDIPQVVDVAEHLPVTEHLRTTEMIAQALTLVPADSHYEGRLLSRYGNALNFEKGDYKSARDAFDRALSIAQREGDVNLEMRTMVYVACLSGEYLQLEDTLAKSLRTVQLARHEPNPQVELLAHFWASTSHYALGQSADAVSHAATCLKLADRLRVPSQITTALWANETLARLRGDWTVASEHITRGLELAPEDSRLLAGKLLMEYQLGDKNGASATLNKLLDVMYQEDSGPDLEYALPAIAVPLLSGMDDYQQYANAAQSAANTVLSADSVTPSLSLLASAGLALAAFEKGNSDDASAQYESLLKYQGTMLYGGLSAVDRLLALICMASGRFDDAAIHFQNSFDFCTDSGYGPELAQTCHDYSSLLLIRDDQGDREKAAAMVEQGMWLTEELGMANLKSSLRRQKVLTKAYSAS
jgi:serine/threonine protein kinase/tetratricopeptide (TPR) repeat protein